jgi:predicted nuclease with RNAse H fold
VSDVPRQHFRRFIGIGLGGGRGKTTAVARFEGPPERLTLAEAKVRLGHRGSGKTREDDDSALFRDDVLVRYIDHWLDEHTVVAVDAPLTLPACVRCLLPCPGVAACSVPVVRWMRRHASELLTAGRSDPGKPPVTPYTQRATELLLARAGLKPHEGLGQGMGPLAARAAYLRRQLSPRLRLNENLIEVHPRATLIRLFGAEVEHRSRHADRERAWELRKRMLDGLTATLAFDYVWPEVVVRNPHVFHAVIGAFTAYLWAVERWQGPTDLMGRERATGHDAAARPMDAAAVDLGHLWLEDGWVWAPPAGTDHRVRAS